MPGGGAGTMPTPSSMIDPMQPGRMPIRPNIA